MPTKFINYNLVRVLSSTFLFTLAVAFSFNHIALRLFYVGFEHNVVIVSVITMFVGMCLSGFFSAYLLENFRIKKIYILACALFLMSYFVFDVLYANRLFCYLSFFLLGSSLSLSYSSLVSASIEATPSKYRTKSNLLLAIVFLMSFVCFVIFSYLLRINHIEANNVIIPAAVCLSLLELLRINMIFRAPIDVSLLSLDKFFMPKSWLLMIPLFVVSFSHTAFFWSYDSGIYSFVSDIQMNKYYILSLHLFLFLVLSAYLYKYILNQHLTIHYFVGLLLHTLSLVFFCGYSLCVHMVALSVTLLSTLVMTLRLTSHCQRCTANVSVYLVVLLGFFLGVIANMQFHIHLSLFNTLIYVVMLLPLSIYYFSFIYYLRNKIR